MRVRKRVAMRVRVRECGVLCVRYVLARGRSEAVKPRR